MTKIHFLSDSLRKNSGFANVSKNLMLELRNRGYEVSMTGLNNYHVTWEYGIKSYPLRSDYTSEQVQYFTNLAEEKPDIIFNLFGSDTGDMDSLLEIPLQLGMKRRLWYIPVDGLGLGHGSLYSLKRFTESGGKLVAQCNWGAKQIRDSGIEVLDTIYHGYNEKIFKKLSNKWEDYCWYSTGIGKVEGNPEFLGNADCYRCGGTSDKHQQMCIGDFTEEKIGIMRFNDKQESIYQYYPINYIKELVRGKYVYGFVGANFGLRKRIERLLKAYSILIKGNKQLNDRTILWLHTLPMSNNGINLIDIVKNLGIEKNIIFSYGSELGSGFSEEAMCRLYNIFDCHVSASSGEGFSLPHIESMACGVPQISTNICSFPELIGEKCERGYLVENELQMLPDGAYRGLVNEKHLSECMKQMYDWNGKNKFSDNCIKFSQNYTWNKLTDKWIKVFEKL